MVDLLQGYTLTGYIFPGTIIDNPYAVIYTEARVSPKEQMLNKGLCFVEESYHSGPDVPGHFLRYEDDMSYKKEHEKTPDSRRESCHGY